MDLATKCDADGAGYWASVWLWAKGFEAPKSQIIGMLASAIKVGALYSMLLYSTSFVELGSSWLLMSTLFTIIAKIR